MKRLCILTIVCMLHVLYSFSAVAQQHDGLQQYLDSLSAKRHSKIRKSDIVVTTETVIDLTKFTSYLNRSEVLKVASNLNIRFKNGTITAAPDFAGKTPLLEVEGIVTLDASAGIDASGVSSAVCTAAVGVIGAGTFNQYGPVSGPENDNTKRVILANDDCTWNNFHDQPSIVVGTKFEVNGMAYNILSTGEKNEVEVISKSATYSGGYSGSVTIPAEVTYQDVKYNVVEIGYEAFIDCEGLTNVTIPNSVTKIGSYAFYGCSGLTSIIVEIITPLTIQEKTFTEFEKPTLYVPASALEAYKAHEFWGQFKNIQAIQDAGIPNNEIWYTSKDGKVVTPYDSKVFGANIVSNTYTNGKGIIKFDGNVTSIGDYAFCKCSGLTSVTIPNSVTSIGRYAFSFCSGLTSVTIPNSVTSIGNLAFNGCSGLTSVTIGNSVTSIGSTAFGSCSGLTSVTIPNSVTSIGNSAFFDCKGLTSVTIGNSVKTIESTAFDQCSGLTSVTIPNSVTSIGQTAFRGCSGLTSMVVESGNKVYDSRGNCNAIIKTGLNTLISGCKNTTILNSVTSIGNYAFDGCSGLTSVTIPNSVTSIGNSAFDGCSGLTSVTIPNSVTSIGISAFDHCSGLTSVTIPNSVTSIGNSAFEGCSGLTSVTIGNSVTSIGNGAFQFCSGLTSVTIPNSVTSIGDRAFSNCSGLTSMVVESGNTVYDSRNNCNAIIETKSNTLIRGCLNTIIPNSVTSIGEWAFGGCSDLTSVTIPNSVTSIGECAFYGCSGLTSVTIPNSVTSIGSVAFYGCSGLTSITVEAVTPPSIGKESFNNFEKPTLYVPASALEAYKSHAQWGRFKNIQAIQGASIPNNEIWYTSKDGKVVTPYDSKVFVANIVSNTYTNGKGIIKFDGNVTSIGEWAFDHCSGLTSVTIPNSVTEIGNHAFRDCSGLTSVTIPNSVTSIGYFAFCGCSSLTSVTIPNSVTSIVDYAFCTCEGLISVTIPNSVTSIGSNTFYGCSDLTSVTIPNSVTSIGNSAFFDCKGLTSVTIPNSVTSIGDGAFSGCSGLTSIKVENGNTVYDSRDNCNAIIETKSNTLIGGCKNTIIPNSVTSIGNEAFEGCSGLTSVTIPNSVTSIGSDAFSSCSGLTSIKVESGNTVYDSRGNCNAVIETASNTLISGCKNTTIPNSVTSIGDYAFSDCSGLTSVTIPNTVTSIGDGAFRDCSGLTCVTIPNSVTEIGYYAFYGCSGLTSITVEAITPPSIQEKTFNEFEKPTLYVPASALEAYKAHEFWGQFKNIQAIQGGDPSGTAHSWRVSNRTDIAVDFASINAADASSLVADGDTLYLERGTRLENQTFKKRLVIVGPGYKYDKTGQDALVGYLYAYGEGSEIIGLEIPGALYAYANNLTISNCHIKAVIGTGTSYENEKCVIHSCFIDGVIEGDGEDNTDAWELSNNIFAEGFIANLDNAVINHNTFVASNPDFCMVDVTNSGVMNNIIFHKRVNPLYQCTGNTYTKNVFSKDQKLDNNKWCETLEKIIECTGDPSQEAYYQTFKDGYAREYSTDGSDCGAFGGKEPYVMHGYTKLYVESEEGGGDVDPGFLIEPNDLLALKNLYNRYGGSNWNVKWTFKDANVEAEDFPGVKFTTDVDTYGYHYVQEINLSKNGLQGDVSNWALHFPRLTSLNLYGNNLYGDLTGFVAELSNLKTLDVSYNMLTGLTSLPESVKTLDKGYQMSGKYKSDYYASLEPVRVMISDEGVKTTLPSILTYNLSKNSCVPTTTELLADPSDKSRFGDVVPVSGGYKTTWMTTPYIYKYAQDVTICMRSEDGCLYPAILSYADGDADMSGRTNLLDVQNTINYILNPALLERFNFSAANTYSDKQVNVQDVVCTVNIVLGLPNSPLARKRMSGYDLNSTSNALYTQEEKLWLSTDTETAALDISLQGVSTDEVALMLNRNDFQMLARNTEDGSRYVVYSLTGKTIPVGTTAILRLANDDALPVDALLSTIDAKSIPVSLTTQPTDIANTHADNSAVRIYSVSGTEVYNSPGTISASDLARVLNGLQNGIYVVVQQMDGGTHKKYKYLKK